MYIQQEFVRSFFRANWFSKLIIGRELEADEIAGMYLASKLNCPTAKRNIGVGFYRLGLEAVKWFHPSGSIVQPRAGLYLIPRPHKRQICIGCDWGLSIKVSNIGKDFQDLEEVRDCPRVYVKPEIKDEMIEVFVENGYEIEREQLLAKKEILGALAQNIG